MSLRSEPVTTPPAAAASATDELARGTPTAPLLGRHARRELWTGLDHASIMGVELMAAVLTWAGIGWLLDGWLGTGPWLLVVGALVGNAAGLYLIYLRSGRMDDRERAAQQARREARTRDG